MRACVQRVRKASVTVDGVCVGAIHSGLLVLLGVAENDTEDDVRFMADKIIQLRIFNDAEGKMNRSLKDTGGELLVVSQFTLLGDCRKGRRPSFVAAAPLELANHYYQRFTSLVQTAGIRVATGQFQAMMDVALVNDGPVTMLLDSKKIF